MGIKASEILETIRRQLAIDVETAKRDYPLLPAHMRQAQDLLAAHIRERVEELEKAAGQPAGSNGGTRGKPLWQQDAENAAAGAKALSELFATARSFSEESVAGGTGIVSGGPQVRFKPLVWEHKAAIKDARYEQWEAYSILGRYIVVNTRDGFEWFLQGTTGANPAASRSEAQAAAQADHDGRLRSAIAEGSPQSPHGASGEEAVGWLYDNEDTGREYSEDHPVDSGQVPDATNVVPATAENLLAEMKSAWKAWGEDREELSRLRDLRASRPEEGPAAIPKHVRDFLGKVQGVCMGVAMSGSNHPDPDAALMDIFKEAQSILYPASEAGVDR